MPASYIFSRQKKMPGYKNNREEFMSCDERRLVYRTAYFSLGAQVILGLISLIGFIKYDDSILSHLLLLDFAVQAIEFVFYAVYVSVGMLKTYYRYLDWFLSTPCMLISTVMFLEYLSNKTITFGGFLDDYRNDVVLILVLNCNMLLCGLLHEVALLPKLIALSVGWVPFLGMFAAIFARFAFKTVVGLVLTTFVFVVWALYGVAAFLDFVPKNVMYNILDVVSKNFYGLVVAVYMLLQ